MVSRAVTQEGANVRAAGFVRQGPMPRTIHLDPNTSFQWSGAQENGDLVAYLNHDGIVELEILLDSQNYVFRQVNPKPYWSDAAKGQLIAIVNGLPSPFLSQSYPGNPVYNTFLAAQHTPLHTDEIRLLEVICYKLAQDVYVYNQNRGDDTEAPAKAEEADDNFYERIKYFGMYEAAHERVNPGEQFDLMYSQLPAAMHSINVPDTTNQTCWDAITRMIVEQPLKTKKLQAFLNVDPGKMAQVQHHYVWQMKGIGFAVDPGIGLGGFDIEMKIDKISPDTWNYTYDGAWGGVSGGVGAGAFDFETAPSDIYSYDNWIRDNFVGNFATFDVSAGATLLGDEDALEDIADWFWQKVTNDPNAQIPLSYGSIIFYGDGQYELMYGRSLGSWDLTGVAAVAGANAFGGYLLISGTKATRPPSVDFSFLSQQISEAETYNDFAVDVSDLTPDGKANLRLLVATYRTDFESPATVLSVEGYASPTPEDKPEYNMTLSDARARSVYQFLRDLMG